MKEMKLKLLLFLLVVLVAPWSYAQVGIGTNNPDANAILDLESTTKGLLLPRVDLLNEDTYLVTGISVVPVQSMLVYNTGTNLDKGFYYWNIIAGVGKWMPIIDEKMFDTKLATYEYNLTANKIFVGKAGDNKAEEVGLRGLSLDGTGSDKTLGIEEKSVTNAMLTADNLGAGNVLVSSGVGGGVVWEKKSEFKITLLTEDQVLDKINHGTVIVNPIIDESVKITLPKGATGERYTIKKGNDTNGIVKIVVDPATATDKFAGGVLAEIQGNVPYQSWTVVWDGTVWQVLNSF